jgi:hypothetical protein
MEEIDIDSAQCKYTLLVDTGVYFSNSICGLLWEMMTHRFWHWRKGHGWMD